MIEQWRTRGIRGATTVEENTCDAINKASIELLNILIAQNNINKDDIVSTIFTLTHDLDAAFPAKTARIEFGWDDVPMLCTQEIPVPGSLTMCIRILITINTTLTNDQIKHVYLNRAKQLRPDIAGN